MNSLLSASFPEFQIKKLFPNLCSMSLDPFESFPMTGSG
jgi:hypothetical protein